MKINIKPLSVNNVWQGKRFKTKTYKEYEQLLSYLLPKIKIPKGKLRMNIIWGFSSKANDIDNPIKPFLDVLQKTYNFNDKMIYEMNIKKEDVEKGKEYLDFTIKSMP